MSKLSLARMALAAAAAVAVSPVFATPEYNNFNYSPTNGGVAGGGIQTANDLTGEYAETLFITGPGTFESVLYFSIAEYAEDDTLTGTNPQTAPTAFTLYGTETAFGTIGSLGPLTTFSATSGTISVFLDVGNNATVTAPSTIAPPAPYVVNANGDTQIAVATGTVTSGTGVANLGFNQDSTFNVSDTNFFTAPVPFYDLSMSSGNFNGTFPAITGAAYTISGSVDVNFGNVPEPGTVALVGVALVGLGVARRRKA